MVYSSVWGSRYATIIFKYASQSIKTLRILVRERPKTVIVMTPPVFACVPVWLYSRLTGGKFIIDAHSGAFLHPLWERLLSVHKFFSRQAAATLVTNDHLLDFVENWGAHAVLVPDVPIDFGAAPMKGF